MANTLFSKIIKSLWVLLAFIPLINGLGFAYIGAKEFKSNWIKEGLVYEIPWFLQFIFTYNEDIATICVEFGLLFMLICIIRTFMVYFKYKDILIDDDDESRVDIGKSFSSYWVVFSVIIFLNGLGLIIVGFKRNVRRWVLEGVFFELLWVLYFLLFAVNKGLATLMMSFAVIGWVLSIVRTFMVYFEEERMDKLNYSIPKPIPNVSEADFNPEPAESEESSDGEIIPQFRDYYFKINDLKESYDQKEKNIRSLIDRRFEKQDLTYERFMDVIDNCHKLFYHQVDSALSIIRLAPEYTLRLDESVNSKINLMEAIIDEMNNLIEEFILHDGSDKESEEDIKELFVNMDNLIGSVKDYK